MALQMSLKSFNIFASVLPRKASIADLSNRSFILKAIDLVKEKKAHIIGNLEDKSTVEAYDKTVEELQEYLKTI